jgi:hypothetical protein
MGMKRAALKAFENRLFVEPSAWAPSYQAWQERAQDTRELAERATSDRAKTLLLMIAESYERLARPQAARDARVTKGWTRGESVRTLFSWIRRRKRAIGGYAWGIWPGTR